MESLKKQKAEPNIFKMTQNDHKETKWHISVVSDVVFAMSHEFM